MTKSGHLSGYPTLDDWLAGEEPLEEFKVWKRPVAHTQQKVELP